MTFYETEIKRIKSVIYSNQGQLDTVIATRNYINNHYETDLNLDLLSYIQCTSKFHLLRMFRRYYGQTPKQYLTNTRIEKAKELLCKGTNVSDTCFAIGFDSPCSFSTLFKSRTGLSPAAFQKRAIFTKSVSY